METICQQCGDKGFEDLFVYCVKCLNFAVHYYCLPDIPETFDKLINWFCDDCELKSTKQSPPVKPCSIPSMESDPVISRNVKAVHSKIKSKKRVATCCVVETEEHEFSCDLKVSSCVASKEENRHRCSPVLHPESDNRIALADSTQLVGDPVLSESVKAVHPKIKLKKQDATCGVVETEEQRLSCHLKVSSCVAAEEKRHRCRPVCQPRSNNKIALADSTQLVGDCQPGSNNKIASADSMELIDDPVVSESVKAVHSKIKSKKQDATCRGVETEEHKLPCDLKANSCMATEEEKRHRCSPICQPESNNSLALADSTKFVGDPAIPKSAKAVQPKIKSKKQDVTCWVVEMEEHRLSCDLKASSCVVNGAKRHKCSLVCQPDSANRLALVDSTKLVGDPVVSESVKTVHPKIKSKKQDGSCMVVETQEHRLSHDRKVSNCVATKEEKRHQNSPVLQLGSDKKIAFADSTKLVGNYSLKSKLNMRKGATQTVVKIGNQMKEGGSSQRNGVAERAPLAGGHKLKRKKKYVIHSVTETEEHKYPNPTQQPSKSHKEPSQSKSIHSWSDDLENDVALGRRRTMILEEGSALSKMARSESIRITDSQTSSGDLSIGACNYQPAQPVVDSIWRGSFSTRNKLNVFFEGIAGHLSSKACPMVCEAAGLLPGSLRLEMLPKTAVWPKSFQKSEPCDDNIALYFFPLNRRYESFFNYLVDVMMEQELAMRTTVRNAELLIFTSSELPRLYRTFQGRYYLWGVFRAKQASSSHPVNVQRITHPNPYGVGAGERNVQSPRIWLPGVQ
ncbi:uncharacterized protein LOC127799540 isoform X2 [Diospyros lotus]|uniref:uncharacterized protein LOC127799540 isoform X2 n=1 Tax=Diospyros lotus TaxID=55363 RepID=UPI00224F4F1A|nr:uncharacterized protein LOC127799540 isoform X2 [Diospyros lotus]